MSKRSSGKSKKRNVLGELREESAVENVSGLSDIDCVETSEPKDNEESREQNEIVMPIINCDTKSKSTGKGHRVSFQTVRPCLEVIEEEEEESCADDPEYADPPSDDLDDPDYEGTSIRKKALPVENKRKKQCTRWDQLKKVPYNLNCEWKDCNFSSLSSDEFINHVGNHIPELEIRQLDDAEGTMYYVCSWRECEMEIGTSDEVMRHVFYHGFHTKLKSIGDRMMSDESHPKCLLDPESRNLLNDLPVAFVCCWEKCTFTVFNAQKFYYHVQAHAVCFMGTIAKNEKIYNAVVACQWRGCRSKSRGQQKLIQHLATHTKEKVVACPRAKAQHNLMIHMSTHYSQALYRCDVEDCSFSCRTISTLNKHIKRHHTGEPEATFCCHICDTRYSSGQYLSKHLMKKHNFRLPSGHSRFRYKADADGLHRLETVRYESLEVTQEMIQEGQQPTEMGSADTVEPPAPTPDQSANFYIAYETLDSEG
ncbi:hypothetical protein B566_EDAN002772 [Ephemera danica]|nr:hypothetical protein B566_EDAN002772 [Ephemera danica]